MLGGLLVSSLVLPPRLGALARRHGPQAAASLIVLTCCPKTAAGAAYVREAGVPVVVGVAALHVAALVVGYLIPAGVGAPGWTCRTTAFQCSMRNPALGLGLAAALFHGSPALPLVAAPLVASVFVQNTLGAWMGAALCSSKPRLGITTVEGVSSQRSPQAFKAQSLEAVLRQPTFRRSSEAPAVHSKED
ncbi:hypothetical protein HYH03_006446 [Edaphochlamys debaryana]|uniref:Uncharacterized protein n=1 Tax=Edaphochlamys debaryana TaxID=47281 RepID=A0A835Y5I4_9CHLO|nr:hypothetical protein HYH03_006446 [Edaphochlamys debaryana]|eukprot:KAG2495502.1 hypothetical protein HYH03_006446 [Edaphochlamys debaryana]